MLFTTKRYTPQCQTGVDVDISNIYSLVTVDYVTDQLGTIKPTLGDVMKIDDVAGANIASDDLLMDTHDISGCTKITCNKLNCGTIEYSSLTFTSTAIPPIPPSCSHTPTDNNHLVNKSYLVDNYIQLGSAIDMSTNSITNCTTLGCTAISYPNSLLFIPTGGSTAPPSCEYAPITDNHLVNKSYLVDNYIQLGSAIDMGTNSITNCTTLTCTGITYSDSLLFTSTTTNTTVPPSCSYTPTDADHLVNVQYLIDNYTPLTPALFSINENTSYGEGNIIYIPNNCVNGYTAFGTDENSVVYLPETVTGGNHIWIINQHTSTLTVETQGTTQIWNNGTTSSTISKEGFGTLHFIGLNDNWIYVN
jgi:hypothetical protein